MKTNRSMWLLALITIAGGCASNPPRNPFQIPESQFRSQIETIALASVAVPADLERADEVRSQFEQLISEFLQEAGFEVIPSTESTQLWESMQTQLGGFYDPVTGKRDEAKFEAARKHTLGELRDRYGADAVLHPTISVVMAKFDDTHAYWCDASQAIKGGGTWFAEALAGVSSSGSTPALCLGVVIEDTSGSDLYIDYGGIEVLERMSFTEGLQPVPREELFDEDERNREAVALALDRLAPPAVAGPPPSR